MFIIALALASGYACAQRKAVVNDYLILGGGCFWCVEAVYEQVPGVIDAVSGYSGGDIDNPSYEDVCSGETGHIEVVKVTFDPAVTSVSALLDYFWKIHDPTSRDRQGADAGTQYRSAVFYGSEAQREAVEASVKKAQRDFSKPIVTVVLPEAKFWKAEEYHQDYFRKNPANGYCQVVIAPKLKKVGF